MRPALIVCAALATASMPRPRVPDAIAVPDANEVAFVGHATGVQIYECASDGGAPLAWRLRAPRAELRDDGGVFARHYGGADQGLPSGPYWESTRDGSRVHGGKPASAANPGSIALLRLQALDAAGTGIFSQVTYIQRLATSGGVGPTGPCEKADARAEVPYAADYVFYRPAR